MAAVRRKPAEELAHLARGVVRGDYLIVQADDDWRASLALLAAAGAFDRVPNLGTILVPTGGPNGRGYWLNGRVPACTFECVMVAKGDMPALIAHVERMNAALWPEGVPG